MRRHRKAIIRTGGTTRPASSQDARLLLADHSRPDDRVASPRQGGQGTEIIRGAELSSQLESNPLGRPVATEVLFLDTRPDAFPGIRKMDGRKRFSFLSIDREFLNGGAGEAPVAKREGSDA